MVYKTANKKMQSKIPNKRPKSSETRSYSTQNLKFLKKMRNMLNFPEKHVKTKENPCNPFFEETEI